MPPRITSGGIKWCRRENRPPALNEKAVRCTCHVSLPCPPAVSPRETNECTGRLCREDNAGAVCIAERTEERDEARMGQGGKNEKREVQLIRQPSQVLAFLPVPSARSSPRSFCHRIRIRSPRTRMGEREEGREGRGWAR